MSHTETLRVGFDMDGVLLYNPSRIFRPLISRSKKAHLLSRKELEFYHPESRIEQFLWWLVHKTSLMPAAGFTDLEQLAKLGKIELHIVSARFACLEGDTKRWLKTLNRQGVFISCNFNDQDEQPHLFKQRKIKELELDYFVEDNWDVVSYLATAQTATQVWWLSNVMDRHIVYPHKFENFKAVVARLASLA